MKHLTQDELSALRDGALDAEARAGAERHLNECAACREALAALERQDEALAAALTHDPGEAHFEALAARIEERIAAARERGEPAVRGESALSDWLRGLSAALRKPRTLAVVGSAAALIVGAGVVLVNLQLSRTPPVRNQTLEQRSRQAAERARDADDALDRAPGAGAPDAASAPGEVGAQGAIPAQPAPLSSGAEEAAGERASLPAPDRAARTQREDAARPAPPPAPARTREGATQLAAPPAPAREEPVPPAGATSKQQDAPRRAYEVKRSPSGEDVPVRKPEGVFAQPPPVRRPAAESGEQASGVKPRRAQPLDESQPRNEGEVRPPALAKDAEKAPARIEPVPPTAQKALAPQPSAVLPPGPEASKLEAREEPAALRLCGEVKDGSGRPVPSASVTLVTFGSGVSTDASGRFCLEAPPGEHTLSVIAVGYRPLRHAVNVAADSPPIALTLEAVPVLETAPPGSGIQALGRDARLSQGATKAGSSADAFRGATAGLQAAAGRAARLTEAAERSKSAPRFEAAAAEWERVRERAAEGPLEVEARYRIAEARFRAWELGPTAKRARAATDALTSYLVRAPLGPQRDRAAVWLDRVKR